MTYPDAHEQTVPAHQVTPTLALTPKNLNQYYTVKDNVRTIVWANVDKIPREPKATKY